MAFLQMQQNQLRYHLREYLKHGGFPEILSQDPTLHLQMHLHLFNDIIARDIAARHNVELSKLQLLANYIMKNVASEFSYRRIATALNLHVDTIEKYIQYFADCFLCFTLPLFSYKQSIQFHTNKKLYVIDSGLRNSVALQYSEEFGKLAENLVFLQLKRRGKEISYWKDSAHAIDFVISHGFDVEELIQVCWDIGDPKTKKREINALIAGALLFHPQKLTILTETIEGVEEYDGNRIIFKPLCLWLFES